MRFKLAQQYARTISSSKVIGITGTVGKTGTALACREVLSELGSVVSTTDRSASLDPVFNLPQTLLRVGPRTKNVILEFGIEYPGEMNLWLSLIQPSIGVVTAASYQHSEFLGSLEQIAKEKGRLVENLPQGGAAVLNWDDPVVRKMVDRTQAEVIYFGKDPKNCHVWASSVKTQNLRVTFELNYGVERIEVNTNFVGEHQIYPLLAASAVGIYRGLRLTVIKKALERVEPAEHRLQPVSGHNSSIILDDSYNAAPVSVFGALETLNRIPARRRILVLGEMKELGSFTEKFHRQLADQIFKDKPDLVLLGKGDTKYVADQLLKLGFIPDRLQTDLSNQQIVTTLLSILVKGDVVLIKGARGVRLDEVVKKLAKTKL